MRKIVFSLLFLTESCCLGMNIQKNPDTERSTYFGGQRVEFLVAERGEEHLFLFDEKPTKVTAVVNSGTTNLSMSGTPICEALAQNLANNGDAATRMHNGAMENPGDTVINTGTGGIGSSCYYPNKDTFIAKFIEFPDQQYLGSAFLDRLKFKPDSRWSNEKNMYQIFIASPDRNQIDSDALFLKAVEGSAWRAVTAVCEHNMQDEGFKIEQVHLNLISADSLRGNVDLGLVIDAFFNGSKEGIDDCKTTSPQLDVIWRFPYISHPATDESVIEKIFRQRESGKVAKSEDEFPSEPFILLEDESLKEEMETTLSSPLTKKYLDRILKTRKILLKRNIKLEKSFIEISKINKRLKSDTSKIRRGIFRIKRWRIIQKVTKWDIPLQMKTSYLKAISKLEKDALPNSEKSDEKKKKKKKQSFLQEDSNSLSLSEENDNMISKIENSFSFADLPEKTELQKFFEGREEELTQMLRLWIMALTYEEVEMLKFIGFDHFNCQSIRCDKISFRNLYTVMLGINTATIFFMQIKALFLRIFEASYLPKEKKLQFNFGTCKRKHKESTLSQIQQHEDRFYSSLDELYMRSQLMFFMENERNNFLKQIKGMKKKRGHLCPPQSS